MMCLFPATVSLKTKQVMMMTRIEMIPRSLHLFSLLYLLNLPLRSKGLSWVACRAWVVVGLQDRIRILLHILTPSLAAQSPYR